MDVDEDLNSNVFKKPTTVGLSFQNFVRPTTTSNATSATATNSPLASGNVPAPSSTNPTTTTGTSFSQMNAPFKSHVRRGSSGIFFNTMFCMSHHFRHLKRLHMESMEGLNIIKQPPARAVFRSSLPATPIATPIYRESFPFFTEQTLMERLCRTPSPRRSYSRNSSQMDTSDEPPTSQQQQQLQPMDVCNSPTTIDEESISSSNSASSPNKPTPSDLQSSLNDIYYKISDQFNPD